MNECLLEGYLPTDWRFAKEIPLPEVSSHEEYSDLRQISILPVLSKVFERAIQASIVSINKMLPIKQSGFRKGYSCATALADAALMPL
ncbi:hypothetical protein JTB14_017850 [Gonioctena quinquepunctata]|nr:hypothetical protein JTB14_017850 [Gonioctena quinquepunctata]